MGIYFDFAQIVNAYLACRQSKRTSRSQLAFEIDLESNLVALYETLENRTYTPSPYTCFVVKHPKPREVWAPSFRDRLVHRIIYDAISERFHKGFIQDVYSCIPERGTHAGQKRVKHFMEGASRNGKDRAYFLKADIANFFVSIDRSILRSLIAKRLRPNEGRLFELIDAILYTDHRDQVISKSSKADFNLIPPFKSLWYAPDGKGLPIGNLTSQLFANVYLNELDQFVKRQLQVKRYARYVDDFVILGQNPSWLNHVYFECDSFLRTHLDLHLQPSKKSIDQVNRGTDFVGAHITPFHMTLRKRTIKRAERVARNPEYDDNGQIRIDRINSYLGMLRPLHGFRLGRRLALLASKSANRAIVPYLRQKRSGEAYYILRPSCIKPKTTQSN